MTKSLQVAIWIMSGITMYNDVTKSSSPCSCNDILSVAFSCACKIQSRHRDVTWWLSTCATVRDVSIIWLNRKRIITLRRCDPVVFPESPIFC